MREKINIDINRHDETQSNIVFLSNAQKEYGDREKLYLRYCANVAMTKTPYNIALVKKQKPFFKRNYQGKYFQMSW